ncbi:4-diphosphocytidyl-2-C-methyl-D-erythritol kinase [Roseibaca ekhonensis]|jgi:4-diphosphocytidyl-2-C-methyl-D-erythritol kinase|uniref:4-diphosphocytidyl-2-C-methyl-D-erythritol kinase n=1 Tax=Roseinatronobacter ekhonensis TaxID=254356 RepID=A0A3B0MN35_9RHOB|nr:4-(cytidine 5'-diphospho)-2-C-methyl-D-erythritol kinase [Roseibaca ekhonensis]SUZ31069.1 4-diphosphocytidyl-2-C-methyl-D-erythritol kinase [Roseibaca ekhonensis]
MTDAELAPAKVNLALHVTGQRSDGYHLLDSLVVFTQAGDILRGQEVQSGLTLRVAGPEAAGLAGDNDNLVLRAAHVMQAEGLALELEKHLPVASGLGGGSSDAAAALRLVARLTGRALPEDVLSLGADVPVCMAATPCRMRGIGERVTPMPALPHMAMVLVNPRVGVSTPTVFAALARKDNPPLPDPLPDWADFAQFILWLGKHRNDLQAPACAAVPDIAQVLSALDNAGAALARMSGSGATCFGLFPDMERAERAAQTLRRVEPQWWVQATGLLQGGPDGTA